MPPQTINKAITRLVRGERLITYKGLKDQELKPDLMMGNNASFYTVQPQDVIVTPKKAVEKGWITAKSTGFSLSGRSGAEILMSMLRKIGSFYERQNDNLTIAEVREALLNGMVLEEYEDDVRGESCLVVGFTNSGKLLHIVCGELEGDLVIITVYVPSPPKFKSPYERG